MTTADRAPLSDRATATTPDRRSYLGREEQLERLAELLAGTVAGGGSLVVVRGPAGSGTTATARQLAERAARDGVDVLWGSQPEGIRGRPFAALAEALDSYAAVADGAALYAEVGDAAPPLARIAPTLRRVLPAIPPPAPLDAAAQRLRLHDAVAGWLRRAAARRRLLLVLDDLQWADDDLTDVLGHVLRRLADVPVLLLGTWADYLAPAGREAAAPTDGAAPAPARGAAAEELLARAEIVELPGLDADATGALLAGQADRPLSPAVVELVHQLSAGQPLPAIELYRHLCDEALVGRPGGDRVPPADSLPQSLEEIVAWRMSRLSLEARSALGALACFVEGASPPVLAPVSGLSRARLAEALEQSVQRGLASARPSGGYRIAHERVRRAILDELSPRVRGEALARAAEAFETELGADARQHAADLVAMHAQLAEPRSTAAVRHCIVVAEQARAAAAYRRAAGCLALALRLAQAAESALDHPAGLRHGDPTIHELLLRLALAEAEANRPAAALSATERALKQAAGRPEAELVIAAARQLVGYGDREAAEQLRQLLDQRLRATDPLTAARLRLLAGRWETGAAAQVTALFWVADDETAGEVLLREGDESDRAELFAPQRVRSQDETVTLLNLARNWRQPAALLRALHGATVDLSTRLGRFAEARSWAGQYLAAAERYGSPADRARAFVVLARCEAVLGDFAQAAESLAAADELLEWLGEDVDLADERLLAELALAHYRDGDWVALAAQAADLAAVPRPSGLALAAERALASARAGDAGTAGTLLVSVLELARRWPPLTYLRDGALLTGLAVAWEVGWAQHAVAGRTLAALAAAAGVGGNHSATPELAIARMHALAGQLAEARSLFAAQRTALAGAGLRPLRAIVDHDEAVAIAVSSASRFGEAAALLELAAAAFDELSMDGWAGRTRSLLERGFEAASQPGGRLHFTYPAGLSRREADVVRLLAGGAPLEDAAAELDLEPPVAERHLASALAKLGANDPSELPRLARRHGLGGV